MYGVFILRTDGDHIKVTESEDYKIAYTCWKELNDKWNECATNRTSFVLEDPIVTAFLPQLIYEITLRPVAIDSSRQNNPYEKKMQQQGFSSSFPNHQGVFKDIL